MYKHTSTRTPLLLIIVLVASMVAGACGTADTVGEPESVAAEANTAESAADEDNTTQVDSGTASFLDGDVLHNISIEFDDADYEAAIAAYQADQSKEWISVTATIDGTVYENVGIRLKGNSSLFGLSGNGGRAGGPSGDADADNPEALPWLIRLDKYVDGQNHNGIYDIVVRSNNSDTALNEAVALDLLELAGLASQDSAYASFSVNGSNAVLRLVMEHPDDVWMEEAFSADGSLYKAESTGDYSYRGDDPDAYDEVFDLEAGDDDDLSELIAFLDFINNSDDATFYAELDEWLDTKSFATYLAMQELIANADDIDGRGNNSYLYCDPDTGTFTVVPWDHNLAFGGGGGAGGGINAGNGPTDGQGFTPPEGAPTDRQGRIGGGPGAGQEDLGGVDNTQGAIGGGPGGGPGRDVSNILVERFLANSGYAQMYEDALAELAATLFDSGVAADVLADWVEVLEEQAGDLVDSATVSSEASSIARYFGS
jgi:spore coat protein CotH